MVDVAATCAAVLDGLDEDALEYLIETAAPEGGALEVEQQDFEELVVPMLVDAELCEGEESAKTKFAALWAQLKGGSTDADTQMASAGPRLLSGGVESRSRTMLPNSRSVLRP